jgi:hypothetical protein
VPRGCATIMAVLARTVLVLIGLALLGLAFVCARSARRRRAGDWHLRTPYDPGGPNRDYIPLRRRRPTATLWAMAAIFAVWGVMIVYVAIFAVSL